MEMRGKGNLTTSLPSRERGLKSTGISVSTRKAIVAPLAGAWIEIQAAHTVNEMIASLPSRERGLKFLISVA